MNGRAPFGGAVGLTLRLHASSLDPGKKLNDYVDGIMDTLDGSHGVEFTYLPVAYEDDCQVAKIQSTLLQGQRDHYELTIAFLAEG